MQANNFLEFFPFSGIPVFEAAIFGIQAKGEDFLNDPNPIFDLKDKSFIQYKIPSLYHV